MIVIYTGESDAEPQHYDADALTCGEADAISRAIDLPWSHVGQALRNQEPAAMRGVAWAWRKRKDPTLRFTHFDPQLRQLKARISTEEIPDVLKSLDRAAGLTDAERAQGIAEIIDMSADPDAARQVIEAAEAVAAQGPKEEPEPEAEPMTSWADEPSENYATSTTG